MAGTRTVLFICVENACRSLMAEAIFNARAPPGWRAESAGTEPARAPDRRVAGMLAEIGVKAPRHPPRLLTEAMLGAATRRVTMGCLDRAGCPTWLGAAGVEDWALPDPARLDDPGFRAVRDTIRRRVAGLRRELALADRGRPAIGLRSAAI